MDDEDFLAEIGRDDDAQVKPEPEAAPPEPQNEPAPLVEEPAPQPEPASPLTPPIVEAKPDPGFVPITVVLDEREKRQRLEAELAQFRASQQPQQPAEAPNVFEDPDGYATYHAEQAQKATLNAKLDISEELARDKFGDELVDKARDWALQAFQQRPGYFQEVIGQRNPYRYVVEQFQREQIATQVSPSDFEQFMAWKQAQIGLQEQPAPAAAPIATPPQPKPPKSLASAPSAGSVTAEPVQSDEEIFAETFARK